MKRVGMRASNEINSRDYIVSFELYTKDDVPADFEVPAAFHDFETGVFLPRDDPDWFGRSSYQPCLLLLSHQAVRIVPHPSSRDAVMEFPLHRISSVESGHLLLKGWLRFFGHGSSQIVRYNTRGFRAISRFLYRIRAALLRRQYLDLSPAMSCGDGLDMKFENALNGALLREERPLIQFFQASKIPKARRWLLPRAIWTAGDLLVLTDRRLLWITDREGNFRSPYGSIASYAPLHSVRRMAFGEHGTPSRRLEILMAGGERWQIPFALEYSQAGDDFVNMFYARVHQTFPSLIIGPEPESQVHGRLT